MSDLQSSRLNRATVAAALPSAPLCRRATLKRYYELEKQEKIQMSYSPYR